MEMSSIFRALGSHLTHRAVQIEFWHKERLQVPAAPGSPPSSSSLIEASSEISALLFQSCIWWWCGGVWRCRCSSDLFLNNCEGKLWIVKGCRTSQTLPIPLISIRAFDSNVSTPLEWAGNWGSHCSRGACIHFPLCSCFYSLWNKLPSQVDITHPKFFLLSEREVELPSSVVAQENSESPVQ